MNLEVKFNKCIIHTFVKRCRRVKSKLSCNVKSLLPCQLCETVQILLKNQTGTPAVRGRGSERSWGPAGRGETNCSELLRYCRWRSYKCRLVLFTLRPLSVISSAHEPVVLFLGSEVRKQLCLWEGAGGLCHFKHSQVRVWYMENSQSKNANWKMLLVGVWRKRPNCSWLLVAANKPEDR